MSTDRPIPAMPDVETQRHLVLKVEDLRDLARAVARYRAEMQSVHISPRRRGCRPVESKATDATATATA